MKFERQSGVVLHPSSLPGAYGIGEIGAEAYRFAEALARMGQRIWQVLPLGPTSYGDSPYQCLSSFAGNHLLVAFQTLMDDGLLLAEELADFPQFPADQVDYGPVIQAREAVLQVVATHFEARAGENTLKEFGGFQIHNRNWLSDYALFVALKKAHGGRPWHEWDVALRDRDEAALKQAREQHADVIRAVEIQQFLFFDQWRSLAEHAHRHGVKILGDIPIFVAHDSADVWAHPELFFLDEAGRCTTVAGVPPDYFSATGQRWGNPLYRWDVMAEGDFAWWKERMRTTFELVDYVRIDHFRGFEAFWEIPASEETAINGQWVKGPGRALFEAFEKEFGTLPIVAEDLGIITEEVDELREACGFPGMRVLHFIVGNDTNEPGFWPDQFPEQCVVYTGTHDNDTTVGWYTNGKGDGQDTSEEEIAEAQHKIRTYLSCDGSQIHWDLIGCAYGTQAAIAIVPLQDILGLDSSARLNSPGRPEGNWRWRFQWDQLSGETETRLAQLTKDHNRHA